MEVTAKIRCLKKKKAPEYDSVMSELAQLPSQNATQPITNMNGILFNKTHPAALKHVIVIPLLMANKTLIHQKKRHMINLLPFSKMAEQILKPRLMRALYDVIPPNKVGFKLNIGIIYATRDMLEFCTREYYSRSPVRMVTLDL